MLVSNKRAEMTRIVTNQVTTPANAGLCSKFEFLIYQAFFANQKPNQQPNA